MGNESRRTGAYTNQVSADKVVGEITSLFEPFLVARISDKRWLTLQDHLYRLVKHMMSEEKKPEKSLISN